MREISIKAVPYRWELLDTVEAFGAVGEPIVLLEKQKSQNATNKRFRATPPG